MDEAGDASGPQPTESESLEFPLPNLIELENRVFTESWSIPYKEEESLGKCLLSATLLANESESSIVCDLISELFAFISNFGPKKRSVSKYK